MSAAAELAYRNVPVESAHSRLEGFIGLSTGDLFTASQQIIAGHRAEIRDISETIDRQMQRVHPLYSNAIYRLVVNKVSWHALRLTAEQLRLARGCTTNPQPHLTGFCTGTFNCSIKRQEGSVVP